MMSMWKRFSCIALSVLSIGTLRSSAQTQEQVYNNVLPVYVGDLVNEAEASVSQQKAPALCSRLTSAVANVDDRAKHERNCIFHIVLFKDHKDDNLQTVDKQNWFVYSDSHFWSLEDLRTNKRLLGTPHVSVYFIHLNRDLGDGSSTHGPTITPNPTPVNVPPTSVNCSTITPLPAAKDASYAQYTIDVKRKISANVQHLFGLLSATGLTHADQVDASILSTVTKGSQHNLLVGAKLLGASDTASPKCYAADAVFGGGTFDVVYRPSDVVITSELDKGIGQAQVKEAIDTPYTVDNEGEYYFDFSIAATVKRLSDVTYQPATVSNGQSTTSGFIPVTTNSSNAYLAFDVFLPKSDVKSSNWTRYPHFVGGIAFAKQPLHNVMTAIAWGPHFSEFYAGVAFVKQPRVGTGSDRCDASQIASLAGSTNPYGYHFCHSFTMGINLPVTGFANKLGAPK